MTHALAIARAQLSGRSGALVAALVAGAGLVVAAHASPGVADFGPALLVPVWGVTQVIALLIGLSLFGEDLASGRLSFYFARPVSPLAIWAGKLGAGVSLALAVDLLVIGVMERFWPISWEMGGMRMRLADFGLTAGELAMVTTLLVAAGALAGLLRRASARWLALDLAGGALVVAAIVDAGTRLTATREKFYLAGRALVHEPRAARLALSQLEATHGARLEVLFWGGTAAAVAICVAATAAALVFGRSSARRAHTAASLILWATALPVAAALLVTVRTLLSPLG